MTDPHPTPPGTPPGAPPVPAAAAVPAAASWSSTIPAPPRWHPAAQAPASGPAHGAPPAPPPPVIDPAGVSLRGRATQPRGEPCEQMTQPPPVDVHRSGRFGPGAAAPASPDKPARRSGLLIGARGRLAGLYFVTLIAVLLAAGGLLLTLAGARTHRSPAGAWLLFAVLLAAAITVHRTANQPLSAGQDDGPVALPAVPAGPSSQ